MDQVIFEEFKGTGNSVLVLSRDLANKRLFPAIDLNSSATRREELLLSDDQLAVSHAMRRELAGADPQEALKDVMGIMQRTKTNDQLIDLVKAKI